MNGARTGRPWSRPGWLQPWARPGQPRLAAARFAGAAAGAFTLIEMLIVVVLVGVLAGAVVVSLQGRTGIHGLKASGKELAEALRFASTQQRLSHRPHRVAFGDDMRWFRVESLVLETDMAFAPAEGLAGRLRPVAKGVAIRAIVSGGEERALPLEALEFDPDGEMFAGTVELVDTAGEVLEIEVMGATGQVEIR